MRKKLLMVMLLPLAAMAASLSACNKQQGTPVAEDTTFLLEVRKFNGSDESYNPNIDGELLASRRIEVKAGQVTVAEALNEIAPLTDGEHKVMINETDYLSFIETTSGLTTSWFLNDGHFEKETNYVPGDFQWSYMAYNGHYSNGVSMDFLDGLRTYTVVIDGYDGNVGTSPSF